MAEEQRKKPQEKGPKKSMNFYWIQDQQDIGNIHIFWRPKELNMADYFTKHHSPIVHSKTRPLLLFQHNSPVKPSIYHLPYAERVY